MHIVRLTAVLFCIMYGTAHAQRLILQAPVIAQFSVNTTVVTPDRGGTLLGSVSRAADSYKTFGPGPWPSGRSRGRSIEHRSISSHVYVHDFRAMDPYLQSQRRPVKPIDPVREKNDRIARAAKAYVKLAERAEARGNQKTAKWARQKAHEYSLKAQRIASGG